MESPTAAFATFGRTLLSIRRNQVVIPTENVADVHKHDLFQKIVSDSFSDLSSDHNVLSLSWLLRLLNTFTCCHRHFMSTLLRNPKNAINTDVFDRLLKALDLCIAVGNEANNISLCHEHAQVIVHVMTNPTSDAHISRARKALADLNSFMATDKETGNRSFGRKDEEAGKLRHLLQAMTSNLFSPRSLDRGTGGNIYTMCCMLAFIMWVLAVAVMSNGRTNPANFPPPPPPVRQFEWAAPMMELQEMVLEEWRKKGKDKKGGAGLMEEMQRLEQCTRGLKELVNAIEMPMEDDKAQAVREQVVEFKQVCSCLEEGLDVFQQQVRAMFHRILGSRNEVLHRINEIKQKS